MSWTRLIHLTLGAALALCGGFVLLTEVSATSPTGSLLIMAVVLVAAGAALVAAGLVSRLRPGRLGWSLVALTAVVGTLASLLVDRHGIQAQWDLYHYHGYPKSWLDHHAWYDILGEPPIRQNWDFAAPAFAADLVFWGCVGVLLGFLIRLLRPRRELPRSGKVTASA